MSLGYGLKIEQSQKLSVTPKLIQALTILQFNSEELNEYIKNELLENPLLEVEREQNEYLALNDSGVSVASTGLQDNKEFSFDHYVTVKYTLIDSLLNQLKMLSLSEEESEIGEYLIHNIDESGYLRISTEDVAEELKVSPHEVKRVLGYIQRFDPPGVGARDLGETLRIQMESNGDLDEISEVVLREKLEDIGQSRYKKIAEDLNVPEDRIRVIAEKIKKLNPKPGSGYDTHNETKYVIPDVFVEKNEDKYDVSLNGGSSPSLKISSYYDSIKEYIETDEELKEYIKERLNSAKWIINSINQREETILKVAETIVEFQKDYFDKGEKYLKPLTLKDVSRKLGIHESTVSRAVRGKYVQCEKGVKGLKYFIIGGVSYGEENLSSEGVKCKIREIIDSESKIKPYSDQEIADILAAEGVDVSRRTVAKYRDSIGYKTSSKRRKLL